MATQVDNEQGQGLTTLVAGIVHDAQDLIRQQLHLFRVELKNDLQKTKSASLTFIVGAVVTGFGVLFLLAGIALLLHEWWPLSISLWGGFGIVAGVLLLAGAGFLISGKLQFDAFNPLPDKTVEALEENVQWKTKT